MQTLLSEIFIKVARADIAPIDGDYPNNDYVPVRQLATSAWDPVKTIGIAFLITLALEIPILYLFGFKTKRHIFVAVLVNLLSFILLNVFLVIFHGEISKVVILELGVILLEILLYTLFVKDVSRRNIILGTVIANVTSALIGTFILAIIIKLWF